MQAKRAARVQVHGADAAGADLDEEGDMDDGVADGDGDAQPVGADE